MMSCNKKRPPSPSNGFLPAAQPRVVLVRGIRQFTLTVCVVYAICQERRFFMQPLDYLVVCAHPDDAELGIGGTLALLKAQGARVGVLDLTDGEPTPLGSPEIRARETAAATAVLGLDWRGNLGLPNRSLAADLESRRQLAVKLRELRPRCVL